MKCRSVTCIWSGTPPVHRVTATAALNHPPTLYTGGSDGSIIWWNLSNSDSHSEIIPVAMLCGHAAPIADLGICFPVVVSGEQNIDYSSNVALNSSFHHDGALISACTDSMLCVWSRSSGHCRRRRKLPPWVGSPSIIRILPWNPRYACIGCCFIDSTHVSDHHLMESAEGAEILMDKESQNRKPPKCTIVIVDTYTLTVVQTVFHGNLSIDTLKFMNVVTLVDGGEKYFSIMADSFGKQQLIPLSKESHQRGEGETEMQRNISQQETETWEDGLLEAGQVVSFATCRDIVSTVLKDRSLFRQLGSATTIGVIFFMNNVICLEDDFGQSHAIGAMFLESNNSRNTKSTSEAHENLHFLVWSNKGSAVVYRISYLNYSFNYDVLLEIPAASYPLDVRLSFSFVQLNQVLLRIESVFFDDEDPFQCRPHFTIWSLYQMYVESHGKLCQKCKMLGEGTSFIGWISGASLNHKNKALVECQDKLTAIQNSVSSSETVDSISLDDSCYSVPKGQIVSSSMVISENLYAPSAIVYGFFSGDIEVVWFNLFRGLDAPTGSPRHEVDSHISRQSFSGHRGAILCLAAHRMVGAAKGWSFSQVLVSGSMDCTIRIWDLDSGNLITVMQQHVGQVRQIILPPARTEHPWSDCFLSVGEDSCVALTSLETLRVERMFPGHPNYPEKVVWDGTRGYIACLCRDHSGTNDATDVLYIWDVKTGARERVLRGTASHSMFDHFCKEISMNSISGSSLSGNTSVSSLLLPINEDRGSLSQQNLSSSQSGGTLSKMTGPGVQVNSSKMNPGKTLPVRPFAHETIKPPIKCFCPYPGISTLSFDLAALINPCQKLKSVAKEGNKQEKSYMKEKEKEKGSETFNPHHMTSDDVFNDDQSLIDAVEEHDWVKSLEEYLVRFSLSFLHLWDVDNGLDELLITEMKLKRPSDFIVSAGLQGDKGSLTVTFPGFTTSLELWKSSSEFCAMRSLTMVSLAQHMISLSHSSSAASRALAAFYTRNFADKFPDIKPPLLQLLVSFWQDGSEHVRMAARSLFHCAASRAIPAPLCSQQATQRAKLLRSLSGVQEIEQETSRNGGASVSECLLETQGTSQVEEAKLLAWLESYEIQDWISCVGGTSQDAMTSHIIVAAALAIWYPSLVKPSLAALVVQPLVKLVMAMNEKYSSTAAELLAEGMESVWKACIGPEIPRLISDIFFQIECVSAPSAKAGENPAVPPSIRETLVGTLLPSLAMADILGFLAVIESQIWSTASDSPVHLVSLMTLIRVVRGSPRNLVQYLDKVVNFILQTMDPGNSVMRRTCLRRAITALREVIRVFPMVAMNESSTKLAFGDAIGDINSVTIRVYDMQSVTKIKVLDASGPPGLPSLLLGEQQALMTTVISALSFSPDGEGLVAFSEHGLMIRWWSLGSVWWEKLSRNLVPVQCTKVIFVPPGEGFSPKTSRSSIMGSVLGHDKEGSSQETVKSPSYADKLKVLIHNVDLSYRLEWIGERKVLLTRHGSEIGSFPL